ncbi:MAG TPA: PilZ domain-containing protein [Candidatus Limnocylindrales bacterium]|nr:PilZ domain-containing protein [Candidatus Limnocylindrales bacterium]
MGPGTMSGPGERRPGDGTAAHQSARRSGRIVRRIAILLIGDDEEGHTFTENSHTVMLSLHGAGILSKHRFAPEQVLVVRVEETNREAEVRVVGEIATEGDLHTYGVAFLDDALDFWHMEFPPAPVSDEQPLVLPLECGSCGERVEVAHGEFEYDITQIHGGLTRHCPQCGTLTVWRRADGKGPSTADPATPKAKPVETQNKDASGTLEKGRRFSSSEIRSPGSSASSPVSDPFLRQGKEALGAPKPGWRDEVPEETNTEETEVGAPRAGKNFSGLAQDDGVTVPDRILERTVEEEEPVVAAAPEPPRDPTVERRRRARAKVNFFACVKTPQFGLDVVTCLDMSKGGVGFRSQNKYRQEMKIQIAVPYAPEMKNAPAIFVWGRIANVREMDGMWRCGVEFLKGV